MRTPSLCVVAAVLAGPCVPGAAEVVQPLAWQQAPEGARLMPPAPGQTGPALHIERLAPGTVALQRLDRPPLRTATWAVTGQVRCQDVHGRAFLEMWSVFADGSRYFSRTLADAGPSAALRGTSDWRPFVVPFASRPELPAPVALELNLVFEASGAVELRELVLRQYGSGEEPLAGARGAAWWSGRQGGLIGATFGTLLVGLGALVGWLASRGRAARFVLALTAGLAIAGVLALAAGAFALERAQPYAVWYPLALGGALSLGLALVGYPRLRARYRELELRRMQALDAR